MKKLLSLVLICVMGFGMISCVESEESQSVTELRNAKAEQLKALVNLYNAQAEAARITAQAEAALKAAEAAYQQALADGKEQENQRAAELFALELEKIKATYEAEIMKQKGLLAQYEKTLMDNLAKLETSLEAQLISLYNTYSSYVATLNTAKGNLIDAKSQLVKVENEIVSVKEAAEAEIAKQEKIIAEKEEIIATEEAKLAIYQNHEYAGMNIDSLEMELVKANMAWRNAKIAYENNEQKAEADAKEAAIDANVKMAESINEMNFDKNGNSVNTQSNGLPSADGVIGYVGAQYDDETNWLYKNNYTHGYMISYHVKESVLNDFKDKLAGENDPEEDVEKAEKQLAKAEAALEAFQSFKADFEKASEARNAIYAFKRAHENYNEVYETVEDRESYLNWRKEQKFVEKSEELVKKATAQLVDTLNKVDLAKFTTEDYDEWKFDPYWDRSNDMINSMNAFRSALANQETKLEDLETAKEALEAAQDAKEALTEEATEAEVEAADLTIENAEEAVENAEEAVKAAKEAVEKAYNKVIFDAEAQLELRKKELDNNKKYLADAEKNVAKAKENQDALIEAFATAKKGIETLNTLFSEESEIYKFMQENGYGYNKEFNYDNSEITKWTVIDNFRLTDFLVDANNDNIPDQNLNAAGELVNNGLYVVNNTYISYRDFAPGMDATGEPEWWIKKYYEVYTEVEEGKYGYLPVAAEYEELLAKYTKDVVTAKDNLSSKKGSLATAKEWKTNWDAKEKELRDFVAAKNAEIKDVQALVDAYYKAKEAATKASDAVTELQGKLTAIEDLLDLAKGNYKPENSGENAVTIARLIQISETTITTAETAIAAAEEAIKAQEAVLANDQIVWRNVVEYKEALIAELKANIEKYTAQVELYTKLVEDAKAALDAAMSAADAE